MIREIHTPTSIEVLTAGTQHERAWDDIVASFEQCDIYFSRRFCQAFARYDECVARLFCWRCDDATIIYPFFLGRISPFPTLQPPEEWNGFYDVVSPYGYCGPLAKVASASAERTRLLWADFLNAFHAYCQEQRIVCEFSRLHPLLRNHRGLLGTPGLERRGEVVVIDLRQPEEAIWRGFSKENRKKIRRAMADGLAVRQVEAPDGIRAFTGLYHQTMQRVGAREWYFFPEAWLNDLHARLVENLSLFLVFAGDRVVAGASVFHINGVVNNFLSGSDADFACLSPNNILFYEIIRWAKEQKYRWYNLGGGFRIGDGIMQFKLNFSRQTMTFYTYKKVHLSDAYDRLVQAWRQATPVTASGVEPAFFPLYRTPVPLGRLAKVSA